MKPFSKKAAMLSLSASFLVPALVACSSDAGTDNETERTLRIATMGYGSDDSWFRQRFTELYELTHPNITIEVVPVIEDSFYYQGKEQKERPDPLEEMKKMMQGDNPPDVVMVGYEQLDALIAENLLTQLDPMIQKDKFDLSDYVPAVINGLKEKGNGSLYALANSFGSSALIYNKALFDASGVPYPQDNMTWQQTFDLARQVSKGEGADRKYGFSFATYSGENLFYPMLHTYAPPLELSIFNETADKMTVDSDQWESVWKTVIQLKTEKIVPEPINYDMMKTMPIDGNGGSTHPFMGNDFLMGRVAMTIVHFSQLNEIINANKHAPNIQGYTPIDWDVVTMPVHQENPEVGGQVYMDGIMGINAKAQNVADAWDFIKFINGEEYAKIKSSSESNMMARKEYIKNTKDGVQFNVDAFTKLVPAENPFNNPAVSRTPSIYMVQDLGMQQFEAASKGEIPVREALKQWQTQGDAMLKQIKENPNGPIDMMPMPMPVDAVPAG